MQNQLVIYAVHSVNTNVSDKTGRDGIRCSEEIALFPKS